MVSAGIATAIGLRTRPGLAGDWRDAALEERTQRRLMLLVLLSATVLQRFAVPAAGSILGWGYVLGFGAAVWALARGLLRPNPVRIALLALAMVGLLTTMLLQRDSFSLTAFAMLAVIYLPFIACLHLSPAGYRRHLGLFQGVMAFCAWCGIGQWAIQFLLGPAWMFPFDLVLPNALFIPGYNLTIPVAEGTTQLKSTGLWFLEPSVFAQAMALALVVEILFFARAARLALFAAAYLVSFSGTGLVLLAGLAIPVLLKTGRYWLLVCSLALLLAFPVVRDVPPFSFFLARSQEFSNPLSSGSMRFFAPYWFVGDVVGARWDSLLIGSGPGSIDGLRDRVDYAINELSWLKILVEYGLIGTIPFFVFYLHVIFMRSPSPMLSLACLIQFLLLGQYLNAFFVQFAHLVLVGWPRLTEQVGGRGSDQGDHG